MIVTDKIEVGGNGAALAATASTLVLPAAFPANPTHNASSAQVAEYFGLYALQRQWRVQLVDLNTFNGVLEGFKWLCYAMKQH